MTQTSDFAHYCLINDLDYDKYQTVEKHIIRYASSKKLLTFHPLGYLFDAFAQYIQKNITMDEFFLVGDVYSTYPLGTYQKEHKPSLQSVERIMTSLQALAGTKEDKTSTIYTDTLLIVSEISRQYFVGNGGDEELCKQLCTNYKIIFCHV